VATRAFPGNSAGTKIQAPDKNPAGDKALEASLRGTSHSRGEYVSRGWLQPNVTRLR
jgi:hypothetical protein